MAKKVDVSKQHVLIINSVKIQQAIDALNDKIKPIDLEITEHRNDISTQMMAVATSKFCGKEFNVEAFLDWCSHEETWIKSDEAAGSKVSNLPRCWTQAKSNIKRAGESGLNPSEYKTESEMRKAWLTKRKEQAANSNVDGKSEFVANAPDTIDPDFAQRLAALASLWEASDDETKDVLFGKVESLIDEIKEINGMLVGLDVQPPAGDVVEQAAQAAQA